MYIYKCVALRILRLIQLQCILQHVIQRSPRFPNRVAVCIDFDEFFNVVFYHTPLCFQQSTKLLPTPRRYVTIVMCCNSLLEGLPPLSISLNRVLGNTYHALNNLSLLVTREVFPFPRAGRTSPHHHRQRNLEIQRTIPDFAELVRLLGKGKKIRTLLASRKG